MKLVGVKFYAALLAGAKILQLYLPLRALNSMLRLHDARINVLCTDKILKFTAA